MRLHSNGWVAQEPILTVMIHRYCLKVVLTLENV